MEMANAFENALMLTKYMKLHAFRPGQAVDYTSDVATRWEDIPFHDMDTVGPRKWCVHFIDLVLDLPPDVPYDYLEELWCKTQYQDNFLLKCSHL